MARPDRYRTRELGANGLDAIKDAGEGDDGRTTLVSPPPPPPKSPPPPPPARREPIDGDADGGQSSRRGQVSEGELELSRSVASRMGWVPLDQWKRDPTKWVDAPEYLERTPTEVSRLRDRAKRTGAVADAAQDAARQAARVQAEEEVRAAVKAGNEDGAVAAGRKLAAANAPDPRTLAWVARNPWFNSDPVAKAAAVAEARRRADAGESVEDQLDGSEDLIRKLFPSHFPESLRREAELEDEDETLRRPAPRTEREGGEVRLSDVRQDRAAPNVREGSRGGGGAGRRSRELGWGDIPADERDQMSRFVKRFTRRGMTEEAAQSALGVEYWRNKGTQV